MQRINIITAKMRKAVGILTFFLLVLFSLAIDYAETREDFKKVVGVREDYTLELEGGQQVRLIGLELPRDLVSVSQNPGAINDLKKHTIIFIKKLLAESKVKLEFDIQRMDRLGRYLAYAYKEDGTFMNDEILKEGYAQAIKAPANRQYLELFLQSEKEARQNKAGLWGFSEYFTLKSNFMESIDLYRLRDGIFSGEDETVLGLVKINVSLQSGKMQRIEIIQNTYSHCAAIDKAFVIVPNAIVVQQSLDVDAVTGATVSSNGIKRALRDALKRQQESEAPRPQDGAFCEGG